MCRKVTDRQADKGGRLALLKRYSELRTQVIVNSPTASLFAFALIWGKPQPPRGFARRKKSHAAATTLPKKLTAEVQHNSIKETSSRTNLEYSEKSHAAATTLQKKLTAEVQHNSIKETSSRTNLEYSEKSHAAAFHKAEKVACSSDNIAKKTHGRSAA